MAAGVVHAKCETSPLIRPAAVKNITRDKNSGGISVLPPSQRILVFFWGKTLLLGPISRSWGMLQEVWLKL